jgi:hypothetical protein
LFMEIVYFYIFGEQRSSDRRGGGGAQRPVGRGNEPKKTGVRSARARTRGQNPLVNNNAVRISAAAMGGAGDIILIKKNKTKTS